MNSISAEIIADSKNEHGNRITTFILTFPRIILAELNTHRMFSRNSASSRAIPFEKMLKRVQEDPFIPIAWQKDHSGMQGTEYLDDASYPMAQWLMARNDAVHRATEMSESGVTKQLVNRLLEPFLWHTAIVTATEYENFFHLRCPEYEMGGSYYRSRKDGVSKLSGTAFDHFNSFSDLDWMKINKGAGEIHIMALAEAMWDAMNESEPKQLKAGEWHIPFGDKLDEEKFLSLQPKKGENWDGKAMEFYNQCKIKIATARCARVSYINYEGKDDYEADIKLWNKLQSGNKLHASPFEHCGQAMSEKEMSNLVCGDLTSSERGKDDDFFACEGWSGNFRGFIQLRKTLPNENRVK